MSKKWNSAKSEQCSLLYPGCSDLQYVEGGSAKDE